MSGTRLELSPSWILAGAMVLLHAAAGVALMAVVPGLMGYFLAAACLALGLAAAWGRALLGSRDSVRALELAEREIALELKDGRRVAAELGARPHVSRLVVTLPLRRPLRRTVLVSRDMLGAEEFRRLRIWTLWGKLPRVAHKQLSG